MGGMRRRRKEEEVWGGWSRWRLFTLGGRHKEDTWWYRGVSRLKVSKIVRWGIERGIDSLKNFSANNYFGALFGLWGQATLISSLMKIIDIIIDNWYWHARWCFCIWCFYYSNHWFERSERNKYHSNEAANHDSTYLHLKEELTKTWLSYKTLSIEASMVS